MERIEKIRQFLQASPNDNFLRHALALEYIKVDDLATARQLFETILTESPDYIGSYYHLAKLLENQQETQLAIEWYEKGMAAAKAAKDNHAYNELQAAYEDLVYQLTQVASWIFLLPEVALEMELALAEISWRYNNILAKACYVLHINTRWLKHNSNEKHFSHKKILMLFELHQDFYYGKRSH